MGRVATLSREANVVDRADAPLSRGLLLGILCIMGVLGVIVQTQAHIPGAILATVGGVGLLFLFLISLTRPEIPLYMLAAYLPFSKQLTGSFGGIMTALNMTNLLVAIILIAWFSGTATGRQPVFEGNRLHWPVILMGLWGFISFMMATGAYGGWYFIEYLNEFKRWFDPLILYFLFYHLVRDRQRWKNLVVIIMCSLVIVALMAIREYMDVEGASSLESSRVYGIADNPNSLGAFFVYYMFLFVAFWLQRPGEIKRWTLLIPFLLCFRGIMVTFSRGAYLAFGAGCLGLTFSRNKILFFLTAAALWFVVLNTWILPEGIRYRLVESTFKNPHTEITDVYESTQLESQVDTSAATRLVIWEGAKRMIADYPLFGVGLGQFQHVILRYAALPTAFDAHNAYLLAASEQGIPILVCFLLVVLMLLWITYRLSRKATDPFIRATGLGMFAGVLALLVANMFGSRMNSTEVTGYFWVLAALMARADVWTTAELREALIQKRQTLRQQLEQRRLRLSR